MAASAVSARRLRQLIEYRKNQRFSIEIEGFDVARGAADLFPYLRQARKLGQIGVGHVAAQLAGYPTVDTVGKGCERRPVAAAQRVAESVQLALIDVRQCVEQFGRPLIPTMRDRMFAGQPYVADSTVGELTIAPGEVLRVVLSNGWPEGGAPPPPAVPPLVAAVAGSRLSSPAPMNRMRSTHRDA